MKSVNGCCEREERWEGRTAGEDKGRPEGSSAARILMAGGRVTWAGLWLCRLQRSGGQSSLDASRPQLGRLASVAAVWWGRAIHCRVFRAQGSGSRASLPYKLKIRDAVEVSRGGANALHSPRTTPLRYGLFSGPFSGPKSCEGGMSFRQFHVPHDLHRVHLPSLVRTNYNHLCTHPFATLDFLHSSAGQGDNGGAAQQMRTANADAWTMAMAQGPKVPSAASPASSAHRSPPTARTSVEHGADGKAQNNSQRPRVQVGACLKLSWRVPPPRKHQSPPPSLARPESDQSRCSLAGCHGTLHVQRVLSRCQKKGRPGCHPTTCMRASFPDVPRPQVAVLEMASRCGDFRGVSGKSKSIVETSRTAEHVHIGS